MSNPHSPVDPEGEQSPGLKDRLQSQLGGIEIDESLLFEDDLNPEANQEQNTPRQHHDNRSKR